MISSDDYLWFVDRSLDAMVSIVEELGDAGVNVRPTRPPGTNSAYAIVNHCVGVISFWGGHVVDGRHVERDRTAEFAASGDAAGLVMRVRAGRERFGLEVARAHVSRPLRGRVPDHYGQTPVAASQGAALIHVYEELTQHLGHLQAVRDAVVDGGQVPPGR